MHDAARPFASPALVSRAIAAARASGAAVPVVPIADTVKIVDKSGTVTSTVDRGSMRLVQTPQAFNFGDLINTHRRAETAGFGGQFTDDAAMAEWGGIKVATFEGETGNVNLTTADDFSRAQAARLAALGDVRTGFGFDVHQFADVDHVWLELASRTRRHRYSTRDCKANAPVGRYPRRTCGGDIGGALPAERSRRREPDRFLARVERAPRRADCSILDDGCEAPRTPVPRKPHARCRKTTAGIAPASSRRPLNSSASSAAAKASSLQKLPCTPALERSRTRR